VPPIVEQYKSVEFVKQIDIGDVTLVITGEGSVITILL
jgi:hypothetical protein